MMLFVGVMRRLAGQPDFSVEYPSNCSDPDLYKDIVSLLYLYYPQRLGEAYSIFVRCLGNDQYLSDWVHQDFGLSVSLCRNLHVLNEVEEVEEVITPDAQLVATEIYLKPLYIEVLSIPPCVSSVVKSLQDLIQRDVYGRLIQVCQFVYPSPLPLVRAIIDLYNEEWANMFDKYPYEFLKAIRESELYQKESFSNRSYRRP